MNSQRLSMEFVGGISPLPAHSFSFSMNSPLVFSRIGGRRWGRRKKRTSPRRGETCQKHKQAQRSASAWAQTEPSRGPGCAQQARSPPAVPESSHSRLWVDGKGLHFLMPVPLKHPVLTPPPTWHSEQADVLQMFSQRLMCASGPVHPFERGPSVKE